MKVILEESQVRKIISTLTTEDIETRLDSTWATWDVTCSDHGDGLELTKNIRELKKEKGK